MVLALFRPRHPEYHSLLSSPTSVAAQYPFIHPSDSDVGEGLPCLAEYMYSTDGLGALLIERDSEHDPIVEWMGPWGAGRIQSEGVWRLPL